MNMIKRSFGALLGNSMQFYDFTIYAFLAPYISKEFFNFENSFISYLMVFSVFASGYLSRPLGSLLFGYIGDRKGRSYALSKTIIISTVATCSMGLIPGYEIIGIYAPVLLIIFRLLQGIAVSGEEGGAVVLLFEKFCFKNPNIIGGSVLSSVLFGVIIGTVVCNITDLFINYTLITWAWRIPFVLALPFGVVALILRFYLNDYHSFNAAIENNLILKTPTKTLLSKYSWMIFYGVCIVSIYSITTSTLIIHIPYYLNTKIGYSHNTSLSVLCLAITFIALLTPWIAYRTNKIDPLALYKISIIGLILFAPVMFFAFSSGYLILVLCAILIFSIIIALVSCTIFSILVGLFPFNVRYSGVSLAFNLAVTIFSSTTPIVLLFVEKNFKNEIAPGIYLSFISLILLCIIFFLTKKISFFHTYESDIESFMYTHKPLA